MKKFSIILMALLMSSFAFAQEEMISYTIHSDNIMLTGEAAIYFKVVPGDYVIKSKNGQIVFNFEIEKVKDFDIDEYLKYHPKKDERTHLSLDEESTEKIFLFDEDGFRLSDEKHELMVSNYDHAALFTFLCNDPVGSKITLKCVAYKSLWGEVYDLSKDAVKKIMSQKVHSVQMGPIRFWFYL
ncbi:hypothetical protein [Treponema sp.]|uniref:hypothetical protein n=1 Tax=Treponema sp. TaxID=166 RepID=UPI00298DDDFF|nr:hypothetical protein [Treponema sp.]MCR5614277.1 hypothetical protein [Treponema sp.]